MSEGMNRRRFLAVLGATGGGAAALGACGVGEQPAQKLIPYLIQPEDVVPGTATMYATTCRECPAGCGLHAKVREGRVIKLEGNRESPINHGRLCARGQAALEGVYNPDRVTAPMARNAQGVLEPITWDVALQRLGDGVKEARGKGIAFITGHEAGSFGDLVDEWTRGVGGRRVSYEPFAFEALREGNRLAFGEATIPWYGLAGASFIISFGADFLDTWISPVEYQRAFARAHTFDPARDEGEPMAKFVFVGPRMSLTGMNADEWIAAAPGTEGLLAIAMAGVIVREHLGAAVDTAPVRDLLARHTPEAVAGAVGIEAEAITHLAREFAKSPRPVALAGGIPAHYPNGAEIVAAVNVLNYVAGAVGKTVQFGPNSSLETASPFKQMADLVADMQAGKVALLLVQGANPGHSLAAFMQASSKVAYKVVFATTLDETASAADLVLPDLHPLEQWNDARPRPEVFALQQPVMQPVWPDTRQAGDVLLAVSGKTDTFKDYLQGRWRAVHARAGRGKSFDDFWAEALQHGGVYGNAGTKTVRLASGAGRIMSGAPGAPAFEGKAEDPVLVAFPSAVLYDGRGADKPWLQELPDPVSKVAWHAWVEVHPETAHKWGVVDGDYVLLTTPFGAVRAPVSLTPGIRPDVVAVPTGQGHTAFGRYAKGRSFNAFDLLSDAANAYGGRTFAVRVSVSKTRDHRFLASSAGDPRDIGEGEEIIRVLPLARAAQLKAGDHPFARHDAPEYAEPALEGWAEAQRHKASLGDYAGPQPRWAMAIDLSSCTGCSACVTACYAENNIATVGEDLFTRHRQMSWMRIERYWRGGEGGEPVRGVVTPMLCQHCEMAPCEPVCPVYAAYHTPDGLNGQVYNRCVGTRYCANNCPYKVRYFNWYDFAEVGGEYEAWPSPLDWQLNPDVTVREKGVMEKCTFCVQRIRGAQHKARLENRGIRDGDITPACAQSCPSEAIVFGDLNAEGSRVAQLAADPRGYHVLNELNTKSGITYLARVVHGEEA